jgi:hypothetical protein
MFHLVGSVREEGGLFPLGRTVQPLGHGMVLLKAQLGLTVDILAWKKR